MRPVYTAGLLKLLKKKGSINMSTMIISSMRKFIEMSDCIEEIGFSKIYFYNSSNNGNLNTPMIALVPFVDVLILGSDADRSLNLDRLIGEARARHIPVIKQECINKLGSLCNAETRSFQ